MTVVLLHALPLDERMWEPQRGVVPEAVAPRLYGRGRSMGEWAESIADEVDGELVLVGASMGGYCALALARHRPERVRAMLLVGSRPDPDPAERREQRAAMIDRIRNEGPNALWREMVPKLFADASNADPRLLYRDSEGLVAAVEAIRDRADSTEVARAYGERVRFVVGRHENFVTPGELSEFDIRVIRDAGHLVNLERPSAFNAELEEFLTGV